MNYLNKRHFFYVFIGVSIFIYIVLLLLFPESKESNTIHYFKLTSTIIICDLILIFIFIKSIWKWKIFYNWLVLSPNLNGTWKGEICSTWTDPITKKRHEPIPVILTIKQSLFNISCVMRTKEMESYSYASHFLINEDSQILKLVYSYESIPNQVVKNRSPQHFGTISFNISNRKKKKLTGEYWTGRKTTGTIHLKFWKHELYDKYPKGLGEHPVNVIHQKEKTDNQTNTSLKDLKKLIAQNDIEEVLNILNKISPEKLKDELIIIESQYNRFSKKDRLNLEETDKLNISDNKIKQSILSFIQKIEKKV